MTDQPTTPTVDTDELRRFVRAEPLPKWARAEVTEAADEIDRLRSRLTDVEGARDRLRDEVQTVCAQLAQDNAMPDGMGTTFISPLLHVLRSALGASAATPGATVPWSGGPPTTSTVPPLARPVPAAPAEPADTDRLREVADLDERSGAPVGAALLAAADEIDRLRAPLPEIRCPLCSKPIDFGTALTRVDGAIAHEVCPVPAEPGATEVDDLIQKLRAASVHPEAFEPALYADAADALAALAALAASPAPADEGRCRCGCTKAQHVGQSGRLGDPCRFCNTSGQGCPVGYMPAAPPASAVPEERDDGLTASQAAQALLLWRRRSWPTCTAPGSWSLSPLVLPR